MNNTIVRQWVQLSAVWFLVAAIPVGRAWLFDFPDVWFYFIILILGVILAPFMITGISYLQRKGRNWVFIIGIQIGMALALSTVHHFLTAIPEGEMRKRVSDFDLQKMDTTNRMTFYVMSGSTYSVFTSFIMLSAMGLLIVYNEQVRQRGIRESSLRESLSRAQIKALKSELQPHFIFNTLHSVNSLMETDVEKAQDLIEQFSFLMRQYLAVIDRQFYTVRDEVDFLEKYVGVLQYRYAQQISFNTSVSDECHNKDIPVILLQPVIENCIKHGLTSGLVINMRCTLENGMIVLSVKDNGTKSPDDMTRLGIGLRNLQERLAIIYGDQYVYMTEFDNGYVTKISLPAR